VDTAQVNRMFIVGDEYTIAEIFAWGWNDEESQRALFPSNFPPEP
jgi:hypothetical protein